jgi:hypothetical protein
MNAGGQGRRNGRGWRLERESSFHGRSCCCRNRGKRSTAKNCGGNFSSPRQTLETALTTRHNPKCRPMKSVIVIACSFLLLFAGAASAWANCKQISFVPDNPRGSSVPVHAHDHHSESNKHSHDGEIHCPPIDGYLPSATFSVGRDDRIERVPAMVVTGVNCQFALRGVYPLMHGPPGFAHSRIIPPYLLLSVLRI